MTQYTCENCHFTTKNKTDFNRHKSRKNACGDAPTQVADVNNKVEKLEEKIEKLEELLEEKVNINSKNTIIRLVKKLSDLLRDKASITGPLAYYDIIRLLLLCFMEPHITQNGKLADMLNPEHYVGIHDFKPEYIKYLKFSNFDIKDNVMDLDDLVMLVWNMLSSHPSTTNIFPKNKMFNSNEETIYLATKLIQKHLKNIKFDDLDEDVGGVIYEHFVNHTGGNAGRDFGQYFTPRKLIHLIINLNKDVFKHLEEPKTIYDPCAGTAGFLVEMYKTYKIHSDDVHGGEIVSDTFANGLMNLLLTTGSLCNLEYGDSFKNNSTMLYDWIGTNPPFGVKKVYKDIIANVNYKQEPVRVMKKKVNGDLTPATKPIKKKPTCIPADKMYPVVTTDGSALFLQHCIAKLAYGGRCNIVLPAGQLLTGKGKYLELRRHLVEECVLHAILTVEGGTFEHAGVSTVVLFFTKSKEENTGDIEFYETSKKCDTVVKLGTVSHEKLAEKNYSFDWKNHKQVDELQLSDSSWAVKTLGEVCVFKNGKAITKKSLINGPYPVIGGGQSPMGYHNDYNTDENTILCSSSGAYAGFISRYNTKVWKSDCFEIKPLDNILLNNYLYEYLKSIQKSIYELQSGMAQPHVYGNDLKDFKIPIPPIEQQQEIIKRCEEYDLDIEVASAFPRSYEHNMRLICKLYINPLFKSGDVKTLGDVCEYRPKKGSYQSKDGDDSGRYRFYTCSEKIKYVDECLYVEPSIIVNRNGNAMVRYDDEFTTEKDHIYVLSCYDSVIIKYVYYYLVSNIDKIKDMMTGATIKNITKEKLNALKIPVPSLEKQQEIVNEFEKLRNMNETFKNIITDMEKSKTDYLNSLFKGPA